MGLVTPAEYVGCVEQAYRMHGEGRFYMDPKGHIVLDKYPGEWEAMPSYIEEPEAAACKWVSIREQNRERFDLPTVFSILIYTHPETGFPLAICDGSYHTVMRTGAAAAVSAKWLARKDSKVLAIVGGGHMAGGAIETCNEGFDWDEGPVFVGRRPPVPHRRRDQPAARAGPDLRGRRRRRDRRGDRGQEAGPHLRLRDHGLRLDRDRPPGLGHRAPRVRARRRRRRRR